MSNEGAKTYGVTPTKLKPLVIWHKEIDTFFAMTTLFLFLLFFFSLLSSTPCLVFKGFDVVLVIN